MDSFSGEFWDLFLFVVTVASIGGMGIFVFVQSKGKAPAPGSSAESTGHVWDDDLRELNNPLPAWWRNMFYITLVFGALYLVLYPGLGSSKMFFGWTQISQYEEEMAEAQATYGPLFARYEQEPIEALAKNPDALKMGRTSGCELLHAVPWFGCRGRQRLPLAAR